jgi:colanic acid biosynthesis glycosyl transferase WcaI
MKILLLNQTFYPDVVSTAQHLKDLAIGLAEKGHEVTVLCSNRAYDDLQKRFPPRESWRPSIFNPPPGSTGDSPKDSHPDPQSLILNPLPGSTGVSPVDSRVSRESQSPNKQEFPIEIHRVGSLGLGKSAKWKRAADFASFFLAATLKTLRLPRHDAVIALTSPPLISLLGARLAKRWRGRFFYWVMDLNPDEAIAAGWLRPNSFAAKILNAISNYSLRHARKVIVLDRFMQQRIEAKGIATDKIEIIPPWSHDDEVKMDFSGRDKFRKAHGLETKFVVMYSGNHSPCHPLETLLNAAKTLGSTAASAVPFDVSSKDLILDSRLSTLDSSIVFCFIGGGSEWRKIQSAIRNSKFDIQNSNLLCLPYQPFNELSASLSAADLHVVVMGDPFVGTIHPCKIYNVLNIGAPLLYVGPTTGHVPDIFKNKDAHFFSAAHGDVPTVVNHIRCAQQNRVTLPLCEMQEIGKNFAKDKWLPRFIQLIEQT